VEENGGSTSCFQEDEENYGDKMEIIWEVLDIARVIYSKRNDQEAKEKLVQIYTILGDISIENGILL
jgi:hypothetical protein